MKNWLIAPLTVVGLGLIQSAASAAIIRYPQGSPYTATITATPTNVNSQPTAPPIPKFNPVAAASALGLPLVQLKGVEVVYEATIDTLPFSATNGGSNPSTFTAFFEYGQVTTDAPGSGLDVGIDGFGFVDYEQTFNIAPTNTVDINPPKQIKKLLKTTTTGLGDFVVTNDGNPNNDVFNVLLSSNVFSRFTDSNGSTGATPWVTLISLTAEVTYLVEEPGNPPDPIPEPASVLALGVLSLSLGALGKKQKL